MNKDNFFKFAFVVTVIVMSLTFSTARERRISRLPSREKDTERLIYDNVNLERLRKLIAEDKLSDREAMYYRYIE
ncbi:MAG: hypothetical protein JSW17_02160 [Candidatus Omnitrophota bacterium]|nr:MAG: hypothetical protein JSW17_02160 [Candidatus Omnitrophota bacterium]